ncbi:hypothetical protein [uncultured Arthrobacter sp.]|uniref:hypothetical protein n=1 Tax=uncultured Arthrobacter sp. TaxID=114050 RepID=UPI0025FFD77A|nr:hypothetical protein [uncultured Arthrobacter sp.]
MTATDLFPARFDKLGMKRNWAECAEHLLEDAYPQFAADVAPGDFLVVDGTVGSGHAHYFGAAVMSCREVGLSAVLATNVNGMFFRSATDLGLKVWTFPELMPLVESGHQLELDLDAALASNMTTGVTARLTPVPELIQEIFSAGGTTAWAKSRPEVLARTRAHRESLSNAEPLQI